MRNLFLAAAFSAFASLLHADEPKKAQKPEITLKLGDAAPKLKADKWLQGSAVTEFTPEKIYVVEFWAIWCGPCIVMMPYMAEMQADYRA